MKKCADVIEYGRKITLEPKTPGSQTIVAVCTVTTVTLFFPFCCTNQAFVMGPFSLSFLSFPFLFLSFSARLLPPPFGRLIIIPRLFLPFPSLSLLPPLGNGRICGEEEEEKAELWREGKRDEIMDASTSVPRNETLRKTMGDLADLPSR